MARDGTPKSFTDNTDYTRQLRRCLQDDQIPTDVRAEGALILLFGLQTADVLALRRGQLIEQGTDWYLQMHARPLLLPPLLAGLLRQLPLPRVNRMVVQPAATADPLLFPGFSDARPTDATGFGTRLLQHGITTRASRNTARLSLAADIPAAVLADAIGIHGATATLWTQRSRRNWHSYLAHRRDEQSMP